MSDGSRVRTRIKCTACAYIRYFPSLEAADRGYIHSRKHGHVVEITEPDGRVWKIRVTSKCTTPPDDPPPF